MMIGEGNAGRRQGEAIEDQRWPALRSVTKLINGTVLWWKTRWFVFLILVSLLILRILTVQGFFVVIYVHAIYLLNLFIGFLSPQVDPEEEGYVLPVREAEEFRPFQRKLPEFKFWLRGSTATIAALSATILPFLDVPVFWPILLIYFIVLFITTMRQQIGHMIKHRYIPFSWGKRTYGDITRSGSAAKKKVGGARKMGLAFPSLQVASKVPSFAT